MIKLNLIGNLTRDPETRTVRNSNGESSVTNFTIAANDGFGEHKHTEFVRIAAWNGLGATCATYLKKGMKVYVSGPATVNAYLNSEGKPVGQIEMRLESVEFLSRAAKEDEDIEALL